MPRRREEQQQGRTRPKPFRTARPIPKDFSSDSESEAEETPSPPTSALPEQPAVVPSAADEGTDAKPDQLEHLFGLFD